MCGAELVLAACATAHGASTKATISSIESKRLIVYLFAFHCEMLSRKFVKLNRQIG